MGTFGCVTRPLVCRLSIFRSSSVETVTVFLARPASTPTWSASLASRPARGIHTNRSHWSWDGLRNRIEVVRQATSNRPLPEVHVLIQFASISSDPEAAVARWRGDDVPEGFLDSPFVLAGDEERLKREIQMMAELGVKCVTVFEDSADTAARLVGA